MKNKNLLDLYQALNKVSDLSGSSAGGKFAYAVMKNKKQIKKLFDELQNKFKSPDEYLKLNENRIKLCVKYSDKDKEGKSIIIESEYVMNEVNKKKFNKEMDIIEEDNKDLIKNVKKIEKQYTENLEKDIDFELYLIQKNDLPVGISANQLEGIEAIIYEKKDFPFKPEKNNIN